MVEESSFHPYMGNATGNSVYCNELSFKLLEPISIKEYVYWGITTCESWVGRRITIYYLLLLFPRAYLNFSSQECLTYNNDFPFV